MAGQHAAAIKFPGYNLFWRHQISAVLWALLILALCGMPKNAVPESNIIGIDKVVHFGLYAVFALIMIVAFTKQRAYRGLQQRAIPVAIVVGIVYGIVIELLQGTVFATRSPEHLDMIANSLGSMFGLAFFYFIYGKPK